MNEGKIGHYFGRFLAITAAITIWAVLLFGTTNVSLPADAIQSSETARMQGVPASPAYFTVEQPDGTRFRARLFGDERYHYMETGAGYTVRLNPTSGYYEFLEVDRLGRFMFSGVRAGIDSPSAAGIGKHIREKSDIRRRRIEAFETRTAVAVPAAAKKISTTGTVRELVILANFSDTSVIYTQADFNGLFNSPGFNQHGAKGSVRDYYDEVSYGRIQLETTVTPWMALPQTMSYYGANDENDDDTNPAEMIRDAVEALDASGFDFSPFDTDGDLIVDSLAVIHQGRGEEAGGGDDTIWSHMWAVYPAIQVDGVYVYWYYTSPEIYYSQISTIGVYCHEFGHILGLPDYYDTDRDSVGYGRWALMGSGGWNDEGRTPAHFCAHAKIALGWMSPTLVDSSRSKIYVPRLSDNGVAYKFTRGMAQNEYILVENRHQHGFDSATPAPGLILTHVDENVADNDDQPHYRVKLLQADGKWDLENDVNRGDAGDPFPGSTNNRYAGPGSNPGIKSWYQGYPGLAIHEISDPAPTMSFSASYGVAPGGGLRVDIQPQEAVDAGARWRRMGTSTWLESGSIENGVPAGTVTVEFKIAQGWQTPSNKNTQVALDSTATITALYTLKPPEVVFFRAEPAQVVKGGNTMLNWLVRDADEVSINKGVGEVNSSGGSTVVELNRNTTFTLVAIGPGGKVKSKFKAKVVTNPIIDSFESSNGTSEPIHASGKGWLSWDVAGATEVSIDNGIGTVAATAGYRQSAPSATTTYTLTASNKYGSTTATATIAVSTKPQIVEFASSKDIVLDGKKLELSWDVKGADTIAISGVGVVQGSSGSVSVTPATNQTYTLTATNSAGSSSEAVSVKVVKDAADLEVEASATATTVSPGAVEPAAAPLIAQGPVGSAIPIQVSMTNKGEGTANDYAVALMSGKEIIDSNLRQQACGG